MTKLRLNGKDDAAFFGVFDGHGGAQVARFCAKHMPDIFINSDHYKSGDIKQALISTYLAIDEMLRKPEHAEELNRMKAKSSNSNSNGMGLEAVDQQESVGSGTIISESRHSFGMTKEQSKTLSVSEYPVLCKNFSKHTVLMHSNTFSNVGIFHTSDLVI